ncbi:MAG: bacterio-opsin activator domain-containing protein [Halodesulfurarchaeum sp.]
MGTPDDEEHHPGDTYDRLLRRVSVSVTDADTAEGVFEVVASALSETAERTWLGTVDVGTWSFEAADASASDLPDGLAAHDESAPHPAVEEALSEGKVTTITDETPSEPEGDRTWPASVAVVPFTHSGQLYGVAVLGADREVLQDHSDALADLSAIVGHGLARVDCRRTLMAGEGTSVEFQVPEGLSRVLGSDTPSEAEVSIDRTVPLPDGSLLQFVTVRDMDVDGFRARLEGFDDVTQVSLHTRDDGEAVFETVYTGPSIVRTLVEQGAEVIESTFRDRDHYTVARVPEGRDVGEVVTAVKETFPTTEILAQRSDREDHSLPTTRIDIRGELTDRQRVVVESALAAGYFERPRRSTGEDIGETLDISPSTFSQHLRAAHRKVYRALFGKNG